MFSLFTHFHHAPQCQNSKHVVDLNLRVSDYYIKLVGDIIATAVFCCDSGEQNVKQLSAWHMSVLTRHLTWDGHGMAFVVILTDCMSSRLLCSITNDILCQSCMLNAAGHQVQLGSVVDQVPIQLTALIADLLINAPSPGHDSGFLVCLFCRSQSC